MKRRGSLKTLYVYYFYLHKMDIVIQNIIPNSVCDHNRINRVIIFFKKTHWSILKT